MSADYTGRHHETRIGVHRRDHRQPLPVQEYNGRHRKTDPHDPEAVREFHDALAHVKFVGIEPARKPARKAKDPVAGPRYTPGHTRSAKSQKKRADKTSRQLDRRFDNALGRVAAKIWRLGA